MSTTLNLVDHLLTLARRHQELGRLRDAIDVLTKLLGFRELPAEVAEDAQIRLSEMYLKRRRFRKARRHLTAALRHRPDEARYHYLMAVASLAEDRGDLDRAADHFRRSLELDDSQPRCRVEYGILAVRLGRAEEGLTHLRRAVELAPEDADIIGKAAKGLRLAARAEEARDVLRAALFRNPKAPRFRKLWNEFQFQQLRHRQEARRQGHTGSPEFEPGPILLKFAPPTATSKTPRVRHDGPAKLAPPHLHRGSERSDQKNAR